MVSVLWRRRREGAAKRTQLRQEKVPENRPLASILTTNQRTVPWFMIMLKEVVVMKRQSIDFDLFRPYGAKLREQTVPLGNAVPVGAEILEQTSSKLVIRVP